MKKRSPIIKVVKTARRRPSTIFSSEAILRQRKGTLLRRSAKDDKHTTCKRKHQHDALSTSRLGCGKTETKKSSTFSHKKTKASTTHVACDDLRAPMAICQLDGHRKGFPIDEIFVREQTQKTHNESVFLKPHRMR